MKNYNPMNNINQLSVNALEGPCKKSFVHLFERSLGVGRESHVSAISAGGCVSHVDVVRRIIKTEAMPERKPAAN